MTDDRTEQRELRTAEQTYPLAIARGARVVTDDFTVRLYGGEFHFGVGNKQTAAALRKLADHLEAEAAHVQRCEITSTAKLDDFLMTELRLTYFYRDPPRESGT